MANFARHVNVRQKVHLDFDDAVPLHASQRPPFNVETKATSFLVTTNLGFIGLREEISNIVEYTCIRRRITPRSPANRTLIDIDDFFGLIFLNS